MPKFSDVAREKLIKSGRGKGYGDITSREMGAMGGSTTRNLVNLAKTALGGNPDALADVTEDQVFIRKNNDAGPLEFAEGLAEVSQTEAGSGEGSKAPEAQPRRVVGGKRSRATA